MLAFRSKYTEMCVCVCAVIIALHGMDLLCLSLSYIGFKRAERHTFFGANVRDSMLIRVSGNNLAGKLVDRNGFNGSGRSFKGNSSGCRNQRVNNVAKLCRASERADLKAVAGTPSTPTMCADWPRHIGQHDLLKGLIIAIPKLDASRPMRTSSLPGTHANCDLNVDNEY
eukprot:3030431-Amphidinium_carterae.2